MHTLPADHDDSEAPARLPPNDYYEGAADFFDLDHKMVSSSERASTLKQLAVGADPILTHRADRKMTQGGALRF